MIKRTEIQPCRQAPWIIIQARMGSTRLPGKIMLEVMERPLLEYLVERLKRVKQAAGIMIATTDLVQDLQIVDFAKRQKIPCFTGSVEDVLSRYYGAASEVKADSVVRVTSDCPLIDPEIIDQAIKIYRESPELPDYVSNALIRTYPRGMDVEVLSFEALKTAHFEALTSSQKEHVTPFIYSHQPRFKCVNFTYSKDESNYRLTVDTLEDFKLIELLLTSLYPLKPNFTLKDLLDLLAMKPEWARINADVQQKKI